MYAINDETTPHGQTDTSSFLAALVWASEAFAARAPLPGAPLAPKHNAPSPQSS